MFLSLSSSRLGFRALHVWCICNISSFWNPCSYQGFFGPIIVVYFSFTKFSVEAWHRQFDLLSGFYYVFWTWKSFMSVKFAFCQVDACTLCLPWYQPISINQASSVSLKRYACKRSQKVERSSSPLVMLILALNM